MLAELAHDKRLILGKSAVRNTVAMIVMSSLSRKPGALSVKFVTQPTTCLEILTIVSPSDVVTFAATTLYAAAASGSSRPANSCRRQTAASSRERWCWYRATAAAGRSSSRGEELDAEDDEQKTTAHKIKPEEDAGQSARQLQLSLKNATAAEQERTRNAMKTASAPERIARMQDNDADNDRIIKEMMMNRLRFSSS